MADYNDEKKLIAGLRTGDRAAYEKLLDLYQDRVYSVVYRMVGPNFAEDVAQDALVKVCGSIKSFEGRSGLYTWVYRVVVNVCLEHRRKRQLETVPIEEELMDARAGSDPEPSEALLLNEDRLAVNAAIDNLPDLQRDVVVLHELQGLTYHECAKVLGCPVGTVKSRLSNAFKALRESLRDYASEGGILL